MLRIAADLKIQMHEGAATVYGVVPELGLKQLF